MVRWLFWRPSWQFSLLSQNPATLNQLSPGQPVLKFFKTIPEADSDVQTQGFETLGLHHRTWVRACKPWEYQCQVDNRDTRRTQKIPGFAPPNLGTVVQSQGKKSLGLHIRVRMMLCNYFIDRRGEGITRVSNLGSIDVGPHWQTWRRNHKSLEPGFDRRGATLTYVEKESQESRTWVR